MFSFFTGFLSIIGSIWSFCTSRAQQAIGKQKQANADLKESLVVETAIAKSEAEAPKTHEEALTQLEEGRA